MRHSFFSFLLFLTLFTQSGFTVTPVGNTPPQNGVSNSISRCPLLLTRMKHAQQKLEILVQNRPFRSYSGEKRLLSKFQCYIQIFIKLSDSGFSDTVVHIEGQVKKISERLDKDYSELINEINFGRVSAAHEELLVKSDELRNQVESMSSVPIEVSNKSAQLEEILDRLAEEKKQLSEFAYTDPDCYERIFAYASLGDDAEQLFRDARQTVCREQLRRRSREQKEKELNRLLYNPNDESPRPVRASDQAGSLVEMQEFSI